ncbi:MAG: hypothetical protein A3B89_01130 [Candidatus Buchananbacteria bacterium RIFCSPHIGHO2_02_FULL_40_13]|uniref:Uncharacterized protein n=1 Tax=Candidatus Buchananbacteria bacterium RIFCSPLOWO2_01_FULL_39_33 TaxID=1797543 RepID=A0A1G1YGX6_9BACT|nr:MAG: hypothetical protein A2820_01195 [Candidatus Buchananbacteria bacterium RIFCSPHIGHO2_01_FULL_40_35]OGY50472.1 MAG: hypothetical protein A3B89_01130 [Candidatus Buchananbacteria bacterium RIFCSPHIGHO2_02_FULL_40_13]OGY51613.1 MAG: hypothetical protein A3A02_02280 [Candidatus Buchananbacteria bacterium RIFCSPLOWO2_01_FULL_39_33]
MKKKLVFMVLVLVLGALVVVIIDSLLGVDHSNLSLFASLVHSFIYFIWGGLFFKAKDWADDWFTKN